jgi:subtilisin family serine protease
VLNVRLIKSPTVIAVCAGLCATAHADEPAPFVPGEVVVRLTAGADPDVFAASVGTVVLDRIVSRNIVRLDVPAGVSEVDYIDLIDDDARVLSAELNFTAEDDDPTGGTQSIFILERVERFWLQGAMDVVRADEASKFASGYGIIVGVLDSGVDANHPIIRGRIAPGGIDLIDRGTAPDDTGDNADNDNDGVTDEYVGHGTLVAGIVLRVAPEARILPVRVLDSDGGSTAFRMVDGIYHAIDQGADVINLSLGALGDSGLLRQAIDEAVAQERLVVASAGNEGTDSAIRYPAGYEGPGVLSVAATRDNDTRAPFSNFGSWISISAPGDPVVGPVPGDAYARASGTSFAAPIVSGAAALLRSVTPCVPMELVWLRLLNTAVNIDKADPDFAGKMGEGRIDAAAVVGAGVQGPVGVADLNADGRVDIDDLHALHAAPRDLNADGVADQLDFEALIGFLRRGE